MILNGLRNLLACRNGTLCLISISVSSVALLLHSLDGPSFAVIVATVTGVHSYTSHKENLLNAQLKASK